MLEDPAATGAATPSLWISDENQRSGEPVVGDLRARATLPTMSGYERAPLVEALCEFQFASAPDSAWDWTLPGQFYERVKDRFPGRAEARRLDLAVGPTLAARTHDRIQFRRPEGDGARASRWSPTAKSAF